MKIRDFYRLESTDPRIAELIEQVKYHLSVGFRLIVGCTVTGVAITIMRLILEWSAVDTAPSGEKPSDFTVFLLSAEHIIGFAIMVLVTLGILFGLYNLWRAFAFYKQLPENIRKET